MDGLTIRSATANDLDRIIEILHGETGQEAVAIAGCVEAAQKFAVGIARLPDSPQGWQRSAVAELDGRTIGVMQTGSDAWQMTPAMALLAVRVFGVGLVAVLGRARARQRVDHDVPAGAYHISELNVDAAYRNRGIGGALLDHAEREARAAGHPCMSLSTTTINPARRLYERHGFHVAETRTDRLYERYTGIAGRHLMVKEL